MKIMNPDFKRKVQVFDELQVQMNLPMLMGRRAQIIKTTAVVFPQFHDIPKYLGSCVLCKNTTSITTKIANNVAHEKHNFVHTNRATRHCSYQVCRDAPCMVAQ